MIDLTTIATCDLIEALNERPGVELYDVTAHDWDEIYVEGPARVLVVTD